MGESARQQSVVVIVDDDSAVLNALTFAFEVDGYQVRGFSDAESMLQNIRDSCVCYVLDQQLPGISGLDLHDALRSKGENAPTILITTQASESIRKRAAASGVTIVEKPLLGNHLAARVREVIQQADT